MADPITVATTAVPSDDDIARAEAFTHEPFIHAGEDRELALAPGTPRRRALDQALAEIAEGLGHPSTAWRRDYALLLGLERVLSEEEPKLADGTVLSAHQVDALSGTLTALLAEATTAPSGNGAVDVLAGAAILGVEEDDTADGEDAASASEEPTDFEEEDEELDEDDDEDDDDEVFDRAPAEEDEEEEDVEDVTAELEAELDRAEAEAPLADWDEEDA